MNVGHERSLDFLQLEPVVRNPEDIVKLVRTGGQAMLEAALNGARHTGRPTLSERSPYTAAIYFPQGSEIASAEVRPVKGSLNTSNFSDDNPFDPDLSFVRFRPSTSTPPDRGISSYIFHRHELEQRAGRRMVYEESHVGGSEGEPPHFSHALLTDKGWQKMAGIWLQHHHGPVAEFVQTTLEAAGIDPNHR